MSARYVMLAAAVALVAPTALTAQDGPVGEMTWQLNAKMPAALAAQSPMQTVPTIRFQVGGNGRQIGTVMTFVPDGSDAMGAALTGASVRFVMPLKGDSAHIAVAVPPALQATLAGMLAPGVAAPAGYRLSMKLPNIDSIVDANRGRLETEMKNLEAEMKKTDSVKFMPVNLGTTSTVAGMKCENWQVKPPADTLTATPEAIDICLVPKASIAFGMSDWIMKRFKLDAAMERVGADKFFGGRMMVPVKIAASDGSFVMEMMSASATAPAASFFTLPADYHTVDPKALPIPGVGGQ